MNLEGLAPAIEPYVAFVPGAIVALLLAALVRRAVARVLETGPVLGFAVALTFGLVLAATVTPGREAIIDGAVGSGTCEIDRLGLIPAAEVLMPGEALLNVLLFVPLGVALGLCPPSLGRWPAIAVAYASPFAIEATQLAVVLLERQCQSADVVDNLTGLTLGLLAAWGMRRFGR